MSEPKPDHDAHAAAQSSPRARTADVAALLAELPQRLNEIPRRWSERAPEAPASLPAAATGKILKGQLKERANSMFENSDRASEG